VKAVVESQLEEFPKYLAEFRDSKLKLLKSLSQYGVIDGVSNEAKEVLLSAQRKFPSGHIWEQFSEQRGEWKVKAACMSLPIVEVSNFEPGRAYWIRIKEAVGAAEWRQ
jgi:hypothetical protein